ncbi:Surface lipoprotein [Candidatus Terasakiella magnetica]|nr:Surface lipoprotein [Candidatus Terasakiella magnetica]
MKRRLLSFAAMAAVTLVSACATMPTDPEERAEALAINDPLEPTNRAIFDINMYLDDSIMVPVAEVYRDTFPHWFQTGLHNILINLMEPYVAGNDLLQGNPRAAADALGRFMINTTFGLLGVNDAVAETGGAKSHKTDLGITLGVWGFDEGPYLMLPFLGPSNLRDGVGRGAEFFAEPAGAVFSAQGLNWVNNLQMGTDILDTRTSLLDPLREIKRTSLDQYAAIRSLYRQNRAAMITASERGQAPLGGTRTAIPASASAPASSSTVPATADSGTSGSGATPVEKSGAVEFVEPAR